MYLFLGVPTSVWVASIIIIAIVTWMTIWVTNKAYSRKWDQTDQESDRLK